jgi:type I restriction enzyme M protein
MTAPASQIVQKLWNYCSILRDDGLSYGDYLEQLTFLLFLKMADERTREPWNQPAIVPEDYGWPKLVAKDGDALEVHYRHTLERRGLRRGATGEAFGRPDPPLRPRLQRSQPQPDEEVLPSLAGATDSSDAV